MAAKSLGTRNHKIRQKSAQVYSINAERNRCFGFRDFLASMCSVKSTACPNVTMQQKQLFSCDHLLYKIALKLKNDSRLYNDSNSQLKSRDTNSTPINGNVKTIGIFKFLSFRNHFKIITNSCNQ